MVIFLTSSFAEYQPMNEYTPMPLDESNGFGNNLRRYWIENAHFLIFVSDSSDEIMAEHMKKEIQSAFSMAGFSLGEIICFNDKYIENYCLRSGCSSEFAAKEALEEALKWADVFYLSGGHGPTENAFMKKCNLKSLIHDNNIFDGIFIGLSAGSVNAADEVYLIPELPGESTNPEYVRFTDGLGLTSINVIPHLDYIQTVCLDGKKLIDEIVADDSSGKTFYLIPDGSYFIIRNGITEFFGKGLIMENGVTRPLHSGIINSDNRHFRENCNAIFDVSISEYHDWILEFNTQNNHIEFFHVSDSFLENGIIPVNIDSFDQLNRIFAKKFVVNEEKQSYLEQSQINVIIDEINTKGSYVRTVHIDTTDGIKAERLSVKQITNDEHRFIASLTDISMILDHDWMTDEYSRSGFLARAEKLLNEPEYQDGYSVVYANIQGFKAVNDLLGTKGGDIVIFWERTTLVDELEPILIARLESDHFALITKTENITEEKMNKLCHQYYTEGTKRLPILIRCGVYNIHDTSRKITYMLDQAKLAEVSISSDHRICYAVCNEQLTQNYMDQRLFISEIDSSLKKGEFIPYYQPIVDAKTSEIVSAEALIRWKHSERGMIPPGQFIPIFEKEGLTTKLDSYMVNRILSFNIERMNNGKKVVPCAVNLSRVDFYDTKLLDMIKQKLNNAENIHNMLKLEITESAYAVLESDALNFLDEMKKLHLSLLLDDFGSGMSSLSSLEHYEFDVIKLDMGFISKIGKNKKTESVIRHTIGMAHDMGIKVIAEGVEHAEQLEFLQSVDCDMIQGYYFYKPMPEEEFVKLLDGEKIKND